MGVCNSTNIFQGKISKLFEIFNMVHFYIDDVLVIAKNYYKYHINASDKVLQRLTEAVLKLNAVYSFSGLTYT